MDVIKFSFNILLLQCLLIQFALSALAATLPTPTAKPVESVTLQAVANASQASFSIDCHLPGNETSRVTYVEWLAADATVCRLFLQRKTEQFDECRRSLQPLGIGIDDTGLQLVLAPVLARHEGQYRCLAYENSDSYELVTDLRVRDKPSEPANLRCTELESAWAHLAWEPPRQLAHLPVDRYEAASWPDPAADAAAARPPPPADVAWRRTENATSRSHQIAGLSAYTAYCFAVRAVNSIGTGPPAVLCGVRTRGLPPLRGAVTAELLGANVTEAAFVVSYLPDRLRGRLLRVMVTCLLLRHRELSVSFAPPPFDEEDLGLFVPGPRDWLERQSFKDSTEQVWLAKGLQPYSNYKLIYVVHNEISKGPKEFLTFNTSEGVAPPPDLMPETRLQFDTNATLAWNQRRRIPGQLLHYRVRLVAEQGDVDLREMNVSARDSRVLLTGLRSNTKYRVSMAAVTGLGPGLQSNAVGVTTDPSWPSPPRRVQIETGFAAGVVVSWAHSHFTLQPQTESPCSVYKSPARIFPANLLAFRVSWSFEGLPRSGAGGFMETKLLDAMTACTCTAKDWQPRPGISCQDKSDRLCLIIPWAKLATGVAPPDAADLISRVRFIVRSVGLSQWSTSRRYPGCASEESTADIPAAYIFPAPAASHSLDQPVIVGIIVGGCIVLLAVGVIAFLMWKWLCSRRGYRRPFGGGMETLEFIEHEYNGTRSSGSRPQFRPYSQTEFKSLSIPEFREHVLASHANDNSAFQMQFDDVQRSTHRDWPAQHWKLADNLAKNRYTDIYPFDHSRVILFTNNGKRRGDYINANYVDGYHRHKAYIACQGPLPATFDDFWLMVWENKSSVVVMISNFVERGRRKCDQYWPNSGSQTCGYISVKFISQESKAAYCLRQFSIRDTRAKKSVKERLVHHYLYSEWPDYGVPQYPLPVLNFVQKSIRSSDDNGPIVVHCSAGVGRTGTFICIEAQIRQILQQKTVNVRGFLEHIRQQRMRLVQTEEQYVFIHDVLLEFLLCPEREVARDQLPAYIKGLEESGPCGCSRLETQYQLCVSEQPSPHDHVFANKPFNSHKNRSVLPIDSRRVKLTAEPGVEGSDYINASHLHGYFSMNEYIVTQHPLEETVFDFLKMIWDHNCSVVVSVYTEDPPDEPPLPRIWPTPEDDTREAEHLQLYFRNEEEFPFATRREFLMATKRDDYSLVVSLWTLKRWPDLLGEAMDIMKLVSAVSEQRAPPVSALVVMDTYGSSHAGIFCALYTLYHQLLLENSIDVYSLFKLYHLQRPDMFTSLADLQFIYEVIAYHASLSSPSSSLPLQHQQRRDNGGTGGTLGSRSGDRREAQQQLPAQEAAPLSEQFHQLQQEVEDQACGQEKQPAEPARAAGDSPGSPTAVAISDSVVAFSNGSVGGGGGDAEVSNGTASPALLKDA